MEKREKCTNPEQLLTCDLTLPENECPVCRSDEFELREARAAFLELYELRQYEWAHLRRGPRGDCDPHLIKLAPLYRKLTTT